MTSLSSFHPEPLALCHTAGIVDSKGREIAPRATAGDSVIVIHLGPDQTPQVARILRSAWPSVTDLNYSDGKEFHIRLRQHKPTGVCLVYASVSRNTPERRSIPSIFAEVVMRGRVCRTREQIHAKIEEISRELKVKGSDKLSP